MGSGWAEKARDGRQAPLDMGAEEFRAVGHWLVDQLADFYATLRDRPVTPAETAGAIRALLPADGVPARGSDAGELFRAVLPIVRDHALHNGHPRFFGYITSSGAPVGALADFLAAAMNPNVAKWDLAPAASEIETQTIRWIAELIGFPVECSGLMTSGGNMANMLAFVAARRAAVPWNVREEGLHAGSRRLAVYASRETHTWIEKAADLTGIGTQSIRWIETDEAQRMRIDALEARIAEDRRAGHVPILVVGTAGSVSTGAVDPLDQIAEVCARHSVWFHVDGAYGAPAAMLPEAPVALKALAQADSIALDPHKWLYAPLEAGCTLVRDPEALTRAFSYRPQYYHFDDAHGESGRNYYELGVQNSRGFRALKVWFALRLVGREGYERMIRDDIALARRLAERVSDTEQLELGSQHLSITTFRYLPAGHEAGNLSSQEHVDRLNSRLVSELQRGGETYLSNAVIGGRQFLRACIVNLRTRADDVDALPGIVVRTARKLEATITV
jgi:aromatic-L-amino-acid/L-tryptophan decarboxylase